MTTTTPSPGGRAQTTGLRPAQALPLAMPPATARAAALAVVRASTSSQDCAQLLDMLGLDAETVGVR